MTSLAAALTALLLVTASGGTAVAPAPQPTVGAIAHGDDVDLSGRLDDPGTPGAASGAGSAADHLLRMRAPMCPAGSQDTATPLPCPGDPVVPLPQCPDAATLPPLWEAAAPDAVVTAWRLIGPSVCATSAGITPAMVASAFRRVPLTPSTLAVQPDRGWALVNKPVVVHTVAAPQTHATTILGVAVAITATPAGYTWDFGDGAELATHDAGQPWPAGTLTHTYRELGAYRISLTTTWSATYTVAGDPAVRMVPGTATTVTATGPVAIRERRSHLVAVP